MNAQTFLDNFGHIANAPNGVERLRELVFYFAITGGLSSQEDGDSDVAAIREETLRARRSYFEENNVRRAQRKNAELRQTVADVPPWWTLIPAGDLVHLINGRAFKPSDWQSTGLPIIRIQNLNNPNAPFNYYEGELMEGHKVSTGDMLLSWSGTPGTSFGAFIWNGGVAALNQHIFKVIIYCGGIDKQYLKMAINACLEALIGSARGGVGLKHVTKGQIEALQIPLPPLEEQKRIVTKVDELLALCDKLESLQEKCEKIGELARTATLGALSGARPRELQVAWTRVQDNIQLLFGGEKALQDFQDTMVQLAIRGLLSPEYERPVETEKIRNSAAKLRSEYQSKNISRKQKSVPLAQVSEWQYPKHWAVESLDNIAVVIGGVTKGRNLKDRNIESFPYLRVANVQRGFFDLSEMKEISIPIEEFEKYKILEEDLLITEGGDWDKVGRTAIWKSQIPNCIHQNHVFKVRIPSDQLLNEWVALVLNSEVGKQYFASASKQTTNLASINMTQLRSFLLPIPHIIEQKAILQKVNSLVMLYQKATAQSIQEANLASDLAAAIVGRVTGTQFKEQEKMKAPKMELVSTLKVGSSPKQKDQAPLTSLLTKNKGELSAKTLWTHSGLEIAEFYQQLKTEMSNGWIVEPEKAVMKEVTAN